MPTLEYLWVLEGDLKTITPLLIGSGDARKAPPPGSREGVERVEIATAAKTLFGAHMVAAIPGTSLKGAMRAAAGARLSDRAFGRLEAGGLVTFADSPATEAAVDGDGESWDAEQRICLRASTAIDAHLGVADEHKLYYFEYVPAGVTFQIALSGKSYDSEGQRLTDLLAALRPGLSALGSGRAMLGAAVQNGWGAFSWSRPPVLKKMAANEIAAWMNRRVQDGERNSVFDVVAAKTDHELVGLVDVPPKNRRVSITVRLQMEGAVLVNDLWGTGSTRQHDKPSHAALRHGNKAFVPEKSVRGVIRHQAERILRTLGAQVAQDPQIRGRKERSMLAGSPAHALFGAAGWRAPFEVSEFTAESDTNFPRQEFIAIDRFTGGGIEKRKYNGEGARGVMLRGCLKVDLARLAMAHGGVECLGLLALTLRDVAEGDVPLGWGSARGYGAVRNMTAQLDEAPAWADLPEVWRRAIPEADYTVMTGSSGWLEKKAVVQKWVRALNERIAEARQADERA